MKIVSIDITEEKSLAGFTMLDGKRVSKTAWLYAIYENLRELGLINHNSWVQDFAELLGWDEEKSKHLSTDCGVSWIVDDSRYEAGKNVNVTQPPSNDLTDEEIIEIITILEKIDAVHFMKCQNKNFES